MSDLPEVAKTVRKRRTQATDKTSGKSAANHETAAILPAADAPASGFTMSYGGLTQAEYSTYLRTRRFG